MKKYVVLVLVLLSVSVVSPVTAQNDCALSVVDNAGIFGSDIAQVEQAAQVLAQTGAIVRVRTYTDKDISSKEAVLSNVVSGCSDWKAYNGELNNDYILFLLAREQRDTAMNYGARWASILDSQWERIVDGMNSHFPSGQFTHGFVYSVNETMRVIDLSLHPPTLAPFVTAVPATLVPVQPVQSQPAQPTLQIDWKQVVSVVLFIAAIFLAVGFMMLLVFLVNRNQQRMKKIQSAVAAQDRASEVFNELFYGLEALLKAIKEAQGSTTVQQYEGWIGEHGRLDGILANHTFFLDGLHKRYGMPINSGSSLQEAENAEAGYQHSLTELQRLQEELGRIQEAVEQHAQDVREVPHKLETLEAGLTNSLRRIARISERGYTVQDQRDAITGLQTTELIAMKQMLERHEYQAARQQIQTVTDRANEIVTEAEAITIRHEELKQQVGQIKRRLERLKLSIITGRDTFDGMSELFDEKCWISVKGNGTEAENRVEWITTALTQLEAAIAMNAQKWEAAEAFNTDIEKWFNEAESFMRSIASLRQELLKAAQLAPNELEALFNDITAAESFITEHDDDIDEDLETRLARAKQQADKAKELLHAPKPDYPQVMRLISTADGEVDVIAASAHEQFDVADRLRKKAAKALAEAERAVSEAAEYIEDHDDDVESSAKSSLKEAKAALKNAKEADNLQDQIDWAASAQAYAKKAMSEAEDDVEDAEEARRPHYTSYSSTYSGWGSISSSPTKPSSSISFGSFGSSSSGGSARWSAPTPKTGGGTKGW